MPISFYQARQTILDSVSPLPQEQVALLDAAGRPCAADVTAAAALPAFDNSAMDGFALRAADSAAGAKLQVVVYVPAGEIAEAEITPGTAARVMTGAPLPKGADAVVPFEDCHVEGEAVILQQRVKKGDHIRWQGEDIRPGACVLSAGTLLRPTEISLLASLRQTRVAVRRRARVAVLATGDELQDIDELPCAAGVVNSNNWSLAAALLEIGATPIQLGIARDDPASLREKIKQGLQADALITSAGVSAGDRDRVREMLHELHVEEQFWKVAVKPGQPTAFGLYGEKPVFALPGNPVSALLIFEELVRPALLKMMGSLSPLKPLFSGILIEPLKKKPGRLQILRVTLRRNQAGELEVRSAGNQNTGMLSTSLATQGIALLAAERDFFAVGERIEFHFIGPAPLF